MKTPMIDSGRDFYTEISEKHLPCKLTEDEIRALGKESAQARHDLELTEKQKKAAMSEFKETIDSLNATISKKLDEVRTGIQYRDVETKIQYNFATGFVRVIRTDTDEEVSYRRMNRDEKRKAQTALGL